MWLRYVGDWAGKRSVELTSGNLIFPGTASSAVAAIPAGTTIAATASDAPAAFQLVERLSNWFRLKRGGSQFFLKVYLL